MANRDERNASIKEQRRQLIIDTALELFSLRGVDSVKIDEIAKKAQISHGLFYHYFKDKNALLDVIKKETFTLFNDSLKELMKGEVTTEKLFRALANLVYANTKTKNKNAYYIYLMLSLVLQKPNSTPKLNENTENIRKLVEKDQREGLIRNDIPSKDLLLNFFFMLHGLIYSCLHYNVSSSEVNLESMISLFCGGQNK